jgi:hypothetical protein
MNCSAFLALRLQGLRASATLFTPSTSETWPAHSSPHLGTAPADLRVLTLAAWDQQSLT